jgi:hypothetical protein
MHHGCNIVLKNHLNLEGLRKRVQTKVQIVNMFLPSWESQVELFFPTLYMKMP